MVRKAKSNGQGEASGEQAGERAHRPTRAVLELHVCQGDGDYRGQGGRGYVGEEEDQTTPSVSGTGAWQQARRRFEQRMGSAGPGQRGRA